MCEMEKGSRSYTIFKLFLNIEHDLRAADMTAKFQRDHYKILTFTTLQ